MKLFITLLLMLNLIPLFSQENWKQVVPEQNKIFLHLFVLGDKIYQTNQNGEYSIYNTNTHQIEKQDIIGNNDVIYAAKYFNNNFYLSAINKNGSNSRTVIVDDNFNILREKPFLNFQIISSYLFLNNEIYYSVISLPGPRAVIAKSDQKFENIISDYVKNGSDYDTIVVDMDYDNGKIHFITNTGNFYSFNNINEFSWKLNEEVKKFNLDDSRGFDARNDTIFIVDGNGRTIISLDGGITFVEKAGIGLDFRSYSWLIKSNKIFISGFNTTNNKGTIFMSDDMGESWKKIYENEHGISEIAFANNKLYCQVRNGSVYSIDEDVYLSVDKNQDITKTYVPQAYYDVLGNKLDKSNIYNKPIVEVSKCLETGEIISKFLIKIFK